MNKSFKVNQIEVSISGRSGSLANISLFDTLINQPASSELINPFTLKAIEIISEKFCEENGLILLPIQPKKL